MAPADKTSALVQGVSLGTLAAPTFAPATGYVSFFTLALYIAGLLLLSFNYNEAAASKQMDSRQ